MSITNDFPTPTPRTALFEKEYINVRPDAQRARQTNDVNLRRDVKAGLESHADAGLDRKTDKVCIHFDATSHKRDLRIWGGEGMGSHAAFIRCYSHQTREWGADTQDIWHCFDKGVVPREECCTRLHVPALLARVAAPARRSTPAI